MRRAIQLQLLVGLLLGWMAPPWASACEATRDLNDFITRAYGNRIEFDVLRNGKSVGQHLTTFDVGEDGVRVESRMELGVTVFFVPVYRFNYTSRSLWRDGCLRELEAEVTDNGDRSLITVATEGERLRIQRGDARIEGAADLIPTDHWNPRVLTRREVLNTITGRINSVQITPCATDSAMIEAAAPGARCYQYSGDLETRAWYDAVGRWVGLEFTGRDGSTISYVCRNCRPNSI